MSIYPVRLAEWFPIDHDHHEIALIITRMQRCEACGKRVKFSKAVGHHSLPWGYGELWCSWKCCESGKVAKTTSDKRYMRRLRRRLKMIEVNVQEGQEIELIRLSKDEE